MAAAIPIANAVMGAYGAIQTGQSTATSLKAQAGLQQQNASEAEAQGQYNAFRQQLVAGQRIGSITAGYGASGVQSNSGSVMDVLAASAQNSELDRLNILHGADVRSINYENQASLDNLGATSAVTGSYWSAIGAVGLSGANYLARSYAATPTSTGGMSGDEEEEGAASSGSASSSEFEEP